MYKTTVGLVFASLCALVLTANCTIKSTSDTSDGGAGTGNGTAGTTGTAGAATGACVKGATQQCYCDATTLGVQVCVGTTWGQCALCGSGAAGSGSGGAGTAGAAGAGTAGAGTAGAGTAGYAGSAGYSGTGGAGAAGASGAGGSAGGTVAPDCSTCLSNQCQAEFDACVAEKPNPDAGIDIPCMVGDGMSGQYEQFLQCLDSFRMLGSLKRDDVVTCGDNVQGCSFPTCAWPPQGMSPVTADLINCMATAKTNTGCTSGSSCPNQNGTNNAWADPFTNATFPWPANSCAKNSCTAMQ